MPGHPTQDVEIQRWRAGCPEAARDVIVGEEPLEIRIGKVSLAVTMRTPGHDEELTAGFLWTEGIIDRPDAIREIRHCEETNHPLAAGNIVVVEFADDVQIDLERVKRNFYATSSCGICGKASIEQVCQRVPHVRLERAIPFDLITQLPQRMRSAQQVFGQTGGLHAAAVFDLDGKLLCVREDVGRHNAVDKVIGWALLNDELPLSRHLIMVSGRAGFEIVQKALVAGIPALAAVSAPSSLAVSLARQSGMTLIGFLREGGMNVYAGESYISPSEQ